VNRTNESFLRPAPAAPRLANLPGTTRRAGGRAPCVASVTPNSRPVSGSDGSSPPGRRPRTFASTGISVRRDRRFPGSVSNRADRTLARTMPPSGSIPAASASTASRPARRPSPPTFSRTRTARRASSRTASPRNASGRCASGGDGPRDLPDAGDPDVANGGPSDRADGRDAGGGAARQPNAVVQANGSCRATGSRRRRREPLPLRRAAPTTASCRNGARNSARKAWKGSTRFEPSFNAA
jgi:hypothetical protein